MLFPNSFLFFGVPVHVRYVVNGHRAVLAGVSAQFVPFIGHPITNLTQVVNYGIWAAADSIRGSETALVYIES